MMPTTLCQELLLASVILASCASPGATFRWDEQAIAIAKGASVHELDATLPDGRFDRWLNKILPAGTQLEWESNDCGEQTGTPGDENFPICAQVSAKLPDNSQLTILIAVGMFEEGPWSTPEIWNIIVHHPREGKAWTSQKLHELLKILSARSAV